MAPEGPSRDDLPDEAVVVRGGAGGTTAPLLRAASLAAADGDGYVLSTFAGVPAEGETRDDLVRRLCEEGGIVHTMVRTTTAGQLRAAGFALRQTDEPACHYDVDLGNELTDEVVQRFTRMFDEPRRNPCR